MTTLPSRTAFFIRMHTFLFRRGPALAALGLIAFAAPPLLTAQCTHSWRAEGYPGIGGSNVSVNALTEWDPDGAGPRTPVVVVGGAFFWAGTVYAQNVATYDPASGEWGSLSLPTTAVYALATLANGDLLAGHSSGVSRWTGSAWSPLGGGATGTVYALTTLPNGDLVAGGSFSTAGGVVASRIARWNGSAWSPLGSGMSGTVWSLAALPNGDVVAGGQFATAGGVAANNIARWDGTTWSPLGSGMSSTTPPDVLALEVLSTGDLVAAGSFTTAGGVVTNSIARWDGSTWWPLGNGMTSTAIGGVARTQALASLPNGDFVAGGDFVTAGGVSANCVARWDGSAWSPLGSGLPSPGLSSRVYSLLALSNGDVMTAGRFGSAGGVAALALARWDGAAWRTVGTGMDNPVLALATMPSGELIAGGVFRTAGGNVARGIARSDAAGTNWSALGGGVDGTVYEVLVTAGGEIVAGGSFLSAGGAPASLIARWNGSSWAPLGAGVNGQAFERVTAIVELPNGDLVAGGRFTAAGGTSAQNIARWDGSAWWPLGAGTDGEIEALAVLPNGDLVAAGLFATAGGIAVGNIARWDGSAWSPLGSGTNGPLRALLVLPNGEVIAGGSFTSAGGVGASNIARWNGASWSPLGAGADNRVSAMAMLPDGDIVAGGRFTTAGGVFAFCIAQWDGVAWSTPAGGLSLNSNGEVFALAVMPDGAVAAGGSFRELVATQTPAPYLAIRSTSCPATATQNGTGCSGTAGPMQTTSNRPWLGSVFRSVTSGFTANGLGFAALGFSSPGTPLAALHPAGAAGCALHANPDASLLLLPTAGTATFSLAIPNNTAFVGAVLFHQVLQVEVGVGGQLVSLTSSNGLRLGFGSL